MTPGRSRSAQDDDAWRIIAADIVQGAGTRYQIGERVPTYRDMAAQHGVSLTPVRTAYGRLKAAGILEAQAGRGVWLAREPHPNDEIDGPSIAQRIRRLEDDLATLRSAVEEMRGQLPGWPPPR